jgi:hypothetical protein
MATIRSISLAIIAILLCRKLFWILTFPISVGHDQALDLYIGAQLLDGKLLYVDACDTNPPLIFYLDTIPAFAARIFHIQIISAFLLWVWLLAAVSAITGWLLVFQYSRKSAQLPVLTMLIAFALFNAELLNEFGQREHLFVIFFMPFFLLRWLRWTGRTGKRNVWHYLIGSAAALGLCLKPYFFLPALSLELFWICKRRKIFQNLFAPEMKSAFAVTLLYIMHFLFIPAVVRETYFSFMVPLVLDGYAAFNVSCTALLCADDSRSMWINLLLTCILGTVFYRWCSLILPLVIFSYASLIVYVIQSKGWPYHYLPAVAGCFMILGTLVGVLLAKRSQWQIRWLLTISLPVWLFCVSAACYKDFASVASSPKIDLSEFGYSHPVSKLELLWPSELLLKYVEPGDCVLFIAPGGGPEFPLCLQLGLKQGSRFSCGDILSFCQYLREQHQDSAPDTYSKYETLIVDWYKHDISARHPQVIFFQKEPMRRVLAQYGFEQWLLNDYFLVLPKEEQRFIIYQRKKSK